MALSATIHRCTLQVSDLDRAHYQTHQIRIARHPSETDERMMVRVLAFALGLTNFADNTLTDGRYYIVGTFSFLGADIETTAATIEIEGNDANFYDESNQSALANFEAVTAAGAFTLVTGRSFSTGGASGS